MACAEFDRIRCTRQVDVIVSGLYIVETFFQFIDFILSSFFQLVEEFTHFTLLVSRNVAEIIHQRRNFSFLAEVFDA